MLKPQREGGGNNLWGADMVQVWFYRKSCLIHYMFLFYCREALSTMSDSELKSYVLMEVIDSPSSARVFLRNQEAGASFSWVVSCLGLMHSYRLPMQSGS